jgi:lipopolysaccharide assembly outer membrane protein LptD (OstA)
MRNKKPFGSFALRNILAAVAMLSACAYAYGAPPPQASGEEDRDRRERDQQQEGSQKGKPQYQISADKKEKAGGDYKIASGYVDIFYKDMRIQADWVKYNLRTHEFHAKGNILFDTKDQFITANEAILNMDTQQGRFFHAQGATANEIYFSGERIDKIGEDKYKIYNGTFTSCTQATPIWSFKCKEATVNLEDYALLKNPVMRFKKVPGFFLPYIVLPLEKDDRQTGFLIPTFGSSSFRGAYISNAFFWAINRSMDATFYLDYYSKKGLAEGVDYRYVWDTDSKGDASFYFVNPKDTGEKVWKLTGEAVHKFGEDMEIVGRANFFNDLSFIEEFEQDFDRVTLRSRDLQAYLTRIWSYYSLNVMADRQETYFFGGEDDSIVRSHAPQVQFSGRSKRLLNSPVYYSFDTSYNYLMDNRSGAKFHRADFFPKMSLPIKSIPWLNIDPSVGFRYTYYTQHYGLADDGFADYDTVLDDPISREYLNVDVNITGPTFSKIYEKGGEFFSKKFKHVIEPHLQYHYISSIDVFDQLIRFDHVEAVAPLNEIQYGVTNRFYAKRKTKGTKKPMPWEFFTFELNQHYSVDPELRTSFGSQYNRYTGGYIPGSSANRLSPLEMKVRFSPEPDYSLGFQVDYDFFYRQVSRYFLDGMYGSEGSRFYISGGWYRSIPLEFGRISANQIRTNCGIKLFKDVINFDCTLRYDIQRGIMQQGFFRLMYKTQCCSIACELYKFNFNFRQENRVAIVIRLLNVGSFGSQFGDRGFTQSRGGFYYY